MKQFQQGLKVLFAILRWPFHNFYIGLLTAFFIWVTFIDTNDVLGMLKNSWKLREVNNEIAFFKEKIDEVVKEKQELEGSARLQEQFAREKFFMKRADEEIFLVVPSKE
jgi:hypothetical protein